MKVGKRTPRTQMHHDALVIKATEFYEELAEQEGVTVEALDSALTRFCRLSSRVVFKKKLDFELATMADTPDQIREKFVAYLDTEHMEVIDEATRLMVEQSVTPDPATGPVKPPEKN
jgi:hypothetical protein